MQQWEPYQPTWMFWLADVIGIVFGLFILLYILLILWEPVIAPILAGPRFVTPFAALVYWYLDKTIDTDYARIRKTYWNDGPVYGGVDWRGRQVTNDQGHFGAVMGWFLKRPNRALLVVAPPYLGVCVLLYVVVADTFFGQHIW